MGDIEYYLQERNELTPLISETVGKSRHIEMDKGFRQCWYTQEMISDIVNTVLVWMWERKEKSA